MIINYYKIPFILNQIFSNSYHIFLISCYHDLVIITKYLTMLIKYLFCYQNLITVTTSVEGIKFVIE